MGLTEEQKDTHVANAIRLLQAHKDYVVAGDGGPESCALHLTVMLSMLCGELHKIAHYARESGKEEIGAHIDAAIETLALGPVGEFCEMNLDMVGARDVWIRTVEQMGKQDGVTIKCVNYDDADVTVANMN